MRKVEVVPYNINWHGKFQLEAKQLQEMLPEEVKVHHIGSTSIPELEAKPIIDMIMEVNNLKQVDSWNDLFASLGYEAKGENGIDGRRFFIKGTEVERTHHLHVFQIGDAHIDRHLAFRDYMRTHREEARAYADLKKKLAEQFTYDIERYIVGKDAFIQSIDRKAAKWRSENRME
ncbi:GrpB family protein [Microbacteriaceae bacterium 4G12]